MAVETKAPETNVERVRSRESRFMRITVESLQSEFLWAYRISLHILAINIRLGKGKGRQEMIFVESPREAPGPPRMIGMTKR